MAAVPVGVPGVRIGQWTHTLQEGGGTGCTVVLFEPGTVASAEVRGGAPASRELDVLDPLRTVEQIDAAVLTGGSAFGLAAADGVMSYLAEQGRGVPTPAGPVPIVPTLGLFDLEPGKPRPTAESGYAAAQAAEPGQVHVGLEGAGCGARSSRWRGPGAEHPAGLSYAEQRLDGLVVGALVAINAFGDILGPGAQPGVEPAAVFAALRENSPGGSMPRTHTTIGVVLTNARLDKVGCQLVVQGAHDGLARSVHPAHTRLDGDAFIAAATGQEPADLDTVRMLAVMAVADAITAAG